MSHDFLHTYFIQPIVEQGVAGYNIYNTPVYAIIFALAVIGVYKLLKKLQIKVDRNFFIGILPFVVLGSVLRVVRDAAASTSPLLVSPLIYMFVFLVAFVTLLVAYGSDKFLLKNTLPKDYWKIWAILGWVAVVAGSFLLWSLPIVNGNALLMIIGIAAAWAVIFFLLYKTKKFKLLSKENAALIWVHLFDATTTFTALQFFPNYYEQHVVSSFVISFLGPAGQFVLKLVVVPVVLYFLDKELPNPENAYLRNFLKVAVFILGFAPGLRNGIRLVLGV